MKKLFATLLALSMMLTLAACGGGSEPAPAPSNDPAPSQSQAPADKPDENPLGVDKIVIGLVAPQTGPSAFMGVSQAQGIELFCEMVNAEGGILGVPVEFIVRDDESDPTKSLTYVEELVLEEGVNWMIGQSNSACAAATAHVTADNEILLFHPMATSPTIIDPEAYPTAFRVHCSNDSQAKGMINLAKKGGYTEVVIVGDTSDLGVTGMASLNKYAKEYGITVKEEISFVNGDADLSAVANAIKASGTKIVLSYAMGADSAKILEALNRIDYLDKCTIIGYSGAISTNVAALVGTLDLSNFYGIAHNDLVLPMTDTAQELYDAVNAKFGPYTVDGSGRTTTNQGAMRTIEGCMIAKWAIENTKSLDGAVLAKYIEENAANYDSVLFDDPFDYSAENHEGWNPNNISTVYVDGIVNDGVNYFGDVYNAAAIKPMG